MGNKLDIVLAGFGGQGVLFAGKLIAYAGLIDDREVSWMPSYGPEMRGGTASCSVCLSDDPIGSPLVLEPDVLVAMNQPSFDKYKASIKQGGIAVVDSTMVPDISAIEGVTIYPVPATQIAEEEGLKGLANVIITGKLHALTGFCNSESLFASVEKCVPARKLDMVQSNKEALKRGMQV